MTEADEVPKYHELMLPTLNALKALGGSASNAEIHDKVVEILNLPDGVVEIPLNEARSGSKLRNRLHWARTYLKHQRALENNQRGVWTLTPYGHDLTPDDVHKIPRLVQQSRKKVNEDGVKNEFGNDAPENLIVDESVEKELEWNEKLLSVLLAMKPDAFERLCQRVLREAGFTKVEVTGKSGDGGIDGNGVLRVKLVSFQVLFQCKRWRDSVGASVVRDFRGAMVGRADKGLILTTGRFTVEARRESTRDGAPAIDLVDGEDLCSLLKELSIGVKVRQVEEVEIDEVMLGAI